MANKLETYRAYIQQSLKEYASLGTPDDEVETQLIFDSVGIGVCKSFMANLYHLNTDKPMLGSVQK